MNKGKTIIDKEVLDLDLSLLWILKFVKKIVEQYLLPQSIVRICIYSLPEDFQLIKDLLKWWIKHDIKGLVMNLKAVDSVLEFKLELGEYVDSIVAVLPRISEHIDMHSFNVTGTDFEEILNNARHITHEISFAKSDLTVSYEADYSNDKFRVEHLNLDECVISSLHGELLGAKNLIKGIAKSGLTASLKNIDRWKCNISAETFKELLEAHGISHIWIDNDE